MRTKNFVLFLICVVATSIFLILVGNQRPSIQTLVTETHKQLNNLKNFKENLENAEEKRFLADDKYLTLLGFTEHPRLYPAAIWKNTSLPIIVTYLQGHCNSSRCSVINFELSFFPSHVEEERLHAFRPLIIQDALNKAGAVLFLESDQRLVTGHLEPLIQQALGGAGVVSWATHYATSSLTHPKMFDYFQTKVDSFFFLPMVESTVLLFYNLPGVHNGLMLPWVQCALTPDCILPIGAQSGGCRFNKKPQYRYSGCHRYDGSALNIVLGLKFGFDEGKYTYRGHTEKFFRKVGPDIIAAEMAGLEGNATESTVMTRDGI
ncbi:uncharacterized protein LOC111864022 [Cryptotermes secundus]|uniref:uncharacterized protein LOC111864022 n=1 Tax=Cryptotermes secundus TaxID=105785 RepID=UPI000CD7ACE1|nr:uncharacterized protein LOC111864022 [Cryptotermes secundus]